MPEGSKPNMRRIVVMGPPGSGKSTLARCLGAHFGLPVFHLDQAYWRPGWIEAPAEEFAAEVARLSALPAWVIDGNYSETIAPRLRTADTVIYLDIPSWLSLLRVIRRIVGNYGRSRADVAPGCTERLDWGFLRFVATYRSGHRARHLALIHGFSGRVIILCGRGAARRFMQDHAPRD